MKKYNNIDDKLSRILDDLLIASEHIKTALPELRVSPFIKIGESDYIECMKNTLDEYINDLKDIRSAMGGETMEITYNMDTLRHIKKLCDDMDGCKNCPFYTNRKYFVHKTCFFTSCSDGRVPMEWDFNELKEEE